MIDLSKKEVILILLPIFTGILFIAMVFLNQTLFRNEIITARQAIGYEIIFFLPGLVATLTQLPFAIIGLLKKQWKPTGLCLISTVVFWVAIMFGRSQGAAMFYAT